MQIATNGTFPLDLETWASVSAIYVGELNGATLTVEHWGTPLTDGVLPEQGQVEITHGRGAPLKIRAEGVTALITLGVYGVDK